jgi:hypothetical protein
MQFGVAVLRRWGCLPAMLLLAVLLLMHVQPPAGPQKPSDLQHATSYLSTLADDIHRGEVIAAQTQTPAQGPDSALQVPWNGTMWKTVPNLTWASCDVPASTRKVIDMAIGQWTYAASNQGIPVHLSEVPCSGTSTDAQIRIFDVSSSILSSLAGTPDVDVFGMTLARDAGNHVCGIEVTGPCIAQVARVYLFSDNWQADGLTMGQSAKTTAHEIGHAIGLGHAHFCNFDSIMAQNCEPILPGLGGDDVQSIDALTDYARSYFGQTPLNARPPAASAGTGGMTVTYKAGYNMVGGPRGTSFSAATGPLYTILSTDTTYRTLPSSQTAYDGYGYWAYFPQDTTVHLNGTGGTFYSALATPGQWFMVGNANGTSPMKVLGADSVFTYDPQSGKYQAATTLQPGQAAWVKPDKGGLIAVYATSLSRDQAKCYLDLGSPTSC